MNFSKRGYFLLLMIFYYLFVIYVSLIDGDFLRMIWLSGPVVTIIGVFNDSKYRLEIYFATLTSLVLISGLTLSYVCLFMPRSTFNTEYYLSIGIFLFYLLLLILGYIYRDKI